MTCSPLPLPRFDAANDGQPTVDAHAAIVGHGTDGIRMQFPPREAVADTLHRLRLDDHKHPFLALGKHHFVCRHAAFAPRDCAHVNFDPRACPPGAFDRAARDACRAEVLHADDIIGFEEFEARFHQEFFEEWVADLHGRPPLHRRLIEIAGGECRALNTIALAASGFEIAEGIHIEGERTEISDPLRHGFSGTLTRLGGVLSGPVPFALRAASLFTGKETSRKLRRAASICSILGSLTTRFAWIQAGHASAKDYRLPLQLAPEQRDLPDKWAPRYARPEGSEPLAHTA